MGRWVCSPDELKAAFVDPDTGVREAIWADWVMLRDALRSVVGEIAACWIAGSFVSDKATPGDIDCVWIVDAARWVQAWNSADLPVRQFLNDAAKGQIKPQHNIQVDSYVLEWMPSPGPNPVVGGDSYYGNRGYWDSLWVRVKDPDDRLDSIPRRGYLEVILDGYR